MKNRNLILRYFGLAILIIGIVFNFRMFVIEAWPTYTFFIICLIGIIQICFSFYKKIKVGWQIFWCVIPFTLGFAYVQVNAPSKDIYLIPNIYRGKVEILYGNANGQEKESEGFWRIYRIPENGKLKTKYKLKGYSIYLYNCKYYYVYRNGNRELLKVYDENSKEKDSVSVQIINWGNLGINGKSQTFYVDIPNNSFFNRKIKNGI